MLHIATWESDLVETRKVQKSGRKYGLSTSLSV